jgi:hypothetical protein
MPKPAVSDIELQEIFKL